MTDRVFNVLFLCTGNTARSVLAEALLRSLGQGKFNSYSAGSQPKGIVNPFALKVLEGHGISTEGLSSKSWDVFGVPGAPKMDFIFTVCDNAAGEACPFWPGHPATAHWGIEDPAAVEGTEIEKERAFEQAFGFMRQRIAAFCALPLASLEGVALMSKLQDIGSLDGATHGGQA